MDDAQELLPKWMRFVRGVVDSDDLPLNVSRELLQDSRVVRTIRTQVEKQVLAMLTELADEEPEGYAELWKAFGAVLKEGFHVDPKHEQTLAELLRFETSAGEGLRSLKQVKESMKDGQEAIYYVIGESLAQVRSSPHIEALKQKGYEVLYLTDPVDPFMTERLTEYDGVKLVSASDASMSLDAEEEPANEEREAALDDLMSRFRAKLQEHVSEVRLSARLTDSPVCLVVPSGGVQPHIERLLRAAQQDVPVQKRILELNPTHPVLENLRVMLEAGDAEAQIDDWIQLLYETARIGEGSPLDDPAAFNRRVTDLLTAASARG